MAKTSEFNAKYGEQETICEGCGNSRLAHDRAVWMEDGSAFCPPCAPKSPEASPPMTNDKALEAALSALPGEVEVVAWRSTSTGALFLPHHGDPSEDEALVTLTSLQAMQARAEAAERERDEAYNKGYSARDEVVSACRSRAEAAQARVKELEEALTEIADNPCIDPERNAQIARERATQEGK